MTTDSTPQGLPLDRPDGPWRPIPNPQAKPPFPPAADGVSDEQLLQMAAKAIGYEAIAPGEYEPGEREGQGASVEAYGSELIAYGRAAIAADRIQRSNALQPVAWCRSDEFHAAMAKRQSFNGWREQHGDCDMALYADSPAVTESPLMIRYEFEITDEHDQPVASGDAATLEEAEREGRHYLAQYQQDGPCTLELRRVEVLEVSSPEPTSAAAKPPLWRVIDSAYNRQDHPLQQYAAMILAVRDRVTPEEPEPPAGDGEPWPQAYQQRSDAMWEQRQAIRALLTTEAARAEAGE